MTVSIIYLTILFAVAAVWIVYAWRDSNAHIREYRRIKSLREQVYTLPRKGKGREK